MLGWERVEVSEKQFRSMCCSHPLSLSHTHRHHILCHLFTHSCIQHIMIYADITCHDKLDFLTERMAMWVHHHWMCLHTIEQSPAFSSMSSRPRKFNCSCTLWLKICIRSSMFHMTHMDTLHTLVTFILSLHFSSFPVLLFFPFCRCCWDCWRLLQHTSFTV